MPLSNRATRIAIGLIVVLSIVAVGLLIYLVLPSTRGVATQNALLRQQERGDCARTIANHQTEVRDALARAEGERDDVFGQIVNLSLLGDRAGSMALQPDYAQTLAVVDKQRARVEALRPTQELVDERCPKV